MRTKNACLNVLSRRLLLIFLLSVESISRDENEKYRETISNTWPEKGWNSQSSWCITEPKHFIWVPKAKYTNSRVVLAENFYKKNCSIFGNLRWTSLPVLFLKSCSAFESSGIGKLLTEVALVGVRFRFNK